MAAELSETTRIALRYQLAAMTLEFRAAAFQSLLRKARFRPDQPRVPAGNPRGGEWTRIPGWALGRSSEKVPVHLVSNRIVPPDIPENPPPSVKERNRVAVRLAKYLVATNVTLAGARVARWVVVHARDQIVAYLEPARTLEDLISAAREARPGFQRHHIAEQGAAHADGYSAALINSPDNIVSIPTYRHWEITGWYARPNPEYGELSPREYLRGKSWEERRAVGLQALRDHGVLKP